jgi:hypothetical protein
MATCNWTCSCGATVVAHIGQKSFDDALEWFLSYDCAACGASITQDDSGFPPEAIRGEIIKASGLWALEIPDHASSKSKVVHVLRSALKLSILETQHILKRIPGEAYRGTKVEVDWLARLLSAEGIFVKSRKVDTLVT